MEKKYPQTPSNRQRAISVVAHVGRPFRTNEKKERSGDFQEMRKIANANWNESFRRRVRQEKQRSQTENGNSFGDRTRPVVENTRAIVDRSIVAYAFREFPADQPSKRERVRARLIGNFARREKLTSQLGPVSSRASIANYSRQCRNSVRLLRRLEKFDELWNTFESIRLHLGKVLRNLA